MTKLGIFSLKNKNNLMYAGIAVGALFIVFLYFQFEESQALIFCPKPGCPSHSSPFVSPETTPVASNKRV